MAFAFKAGKSTTPKKFAGTEVNPIVYESDHEKKTHVIIVEEVAKGWLTYFNRYMDKNLPDIGYKIIRVFDFKVTSDQLKGSGGVTRFYFKNCPDMTKHIEPGMSIIPMGRALMSVTLDPDVSVEAFYDEQFQATHFYAPELKCYVYPVDPPYKWYSKFERRSLDNFYRHFMWDQIKKAVEIGSPRLRIPKVNKILIEGMDNVKTFFNEHKYDPKLAWDLETGSLDFQTGQIICVTMSFDGKTGYYVRFKDIEELAMFDDFLEGKYQIGANLKFDIKFMKYLYPFKNMKVDFDTWHAGHTLNEMRSNSLKTHAWVYTTFGGYDLPLERFKLKYPKLKSYADIPESILFDYAVMDAIVTFKVYEEMKRRFEQEPNLWTYFLEVVMGLVQIFPDIELTGVDMDWAMVAKVGHEFTERIAEVEAEMVPIFGDINFGGDDLALKLEELGWPCIARDKRKLYKTNKDCRKEWAELGIEGVDLLAKRSELVSAQGMFVGLEEDHTGFWKHKGVDGKLHPNFFVMLAKSHRLRCKNPNLQQFPKHSDIAKIIRKCFIGPTPDHLICESDYDGLQARICSILSGDPVLRDVFITKGGDIHSITGHSIFYNFPKKFIELDTGEQVLESDFLRDNKLVKSKDVERLLELSDFLRLKNHSKEIKGFRRKAKFANFGMLFGSTVYGVCFGIIMPNWTPEECIEFITDMKLEMPTYDPDDLKASHKDLSMIVAQFVHEKFFSTYKKLIPWVEDCHKEGKDNGFVRYTHGGRRLLPQLLYIGKDTDRKEVSGWENITVNTRVQNFEIVVVGRAMIKMHAELAERGLDKRNKLFGQIHDAIQMYIHKDDLKEVYDVIKTNMEEQYPEYEGIELTAEADIADCSNPNEADRKFWGSSPIWSGESYDEIHTL